MQRSRWILGALVLSVATAFGQGTILWDETVNGPLSNDGNNPTAFGALQIGTNSLLGATQSQPIGNNWLVFADYFRFSLTGPSFIAQILFSADKRVAVWLGEDNFSAQLGYISNPVSGELLAQMEANSVGTGAVGMYVMNYEFGASHSIAGYRLDFVVQAIPEPASLWLLLGGLGWLGFRGWRKSRRGKAVTLLLALSVAPAFGQGTILWDEAVNGKLSEDYQHPTALPTLGLGTNSLIGSVEYIDYGSIGFRSDDVVLIRLPDSFRVVSLVLASDHPVLVWFGTSGFDSEWGHAFGTTGDLLPQIADLVPGEYGMYVGNGDFNSGSFTPHYRLDFVVEAIPEPASLWLLLGGLGWLGFRSWRNARLKT